MSAYYSFQIDGQRNLVRITMGGLFMPDDVHAFAAAQLEAHAKLRCGPNDHLTLNDSRGLKIQPQESVVLFKQMLSDPMHRSRRLAIVIGRTLARSQWQRALSGRSARCCETLEEAEAWLFAPELEDVLRKAR